MKFETPRADKADLRNGVNKVFVEVAVEFGCRKSILPASRNCQISVSATPTLPPMSLGPVVLDPIAVGARQDGLTPTPNTISAFKHKYKAVSQGHKLITLRDCCAVKDPKSWTTTTTSSPLRSHHIPSLACLHHRATVM